MNKALTTRRSDIEGGRPKDKDAKGRFVSVPPPHAGIPEKQLIQDLRKAWKKDLPDSEFSFHTADGEKIYIATYPGKGLVLKMGDKAKPSFVTTGMGVRLGTKLIQISNETRFPRV
jgi:hypothetical protein